MPLKINYLISILWMKYMYKTDDVNEREMRGGGGLDNDFKKDLI